MVSQLIHKINSSDIAKRMTKGVYWSLIGTALGKLCVFLTGIVCARILGKELFGELGMVRTTIGMFIVLGAAGIGVTATRYISLYRDKEKSHAASIYKLSTYFSWIVGLFISALVFYFSRTISTTSLNTPDLKYAVELGSIMLLLSIVNGAENGTLVGFEDFRSIATNTFIGSLAESTLMIIGAYYYKLEGAILGFGAGILVLYLLNKFASRKNFKRQDIIIKDQKILATDWKLIYRYSIPATLSALTVTPALFVIRSILIRHNSYSELATFEVADQWKVILLFIPSTISQIVLPILSSIKKEQTFKKTVRMNIYIAAMVSGILALLTIVFSNFIISFYGADYTNTYPLILLSLSTIFSCISNVIEMSIYSKDKMWISFTMSIIWAIILIVLSIYFENLGLASTGLALSVFLSYVIKSIYIGIYAKYKI